jgi:hypothetical protein
VSDTENPEVEIGRSTLSVNGKPTAVREPTVWSLLKQAKHLKAVADKFASGDDTSTDDFLDLLSEEGTHEAACAFLNLFVETELSDMKEISLTEAATLIEHLIDSGLFARVQSVFTKLRSRTA